MKKLSAKEKIGYSVGDVSSNLVWQAIMFFLPSFYTDTYGLPAAVVGTLFIVVRLFDAVIDPLMGTIADRTETRWGKFRPYILWMAVPYGVASILMFITPDCSLAAKTAWAYASYTLMMIIYTAIMIPYNALSGVMSSNAIDRTSLSSYRFIGAFTGGLIIQGLTLWLVERLGGGNDVQGYRLTMSVFAALSTFLFLITFLTTRERVKPESNSHSSLKDDYLDLLRNKPWLLLFAFSFLNLVYVAIRSSVLMYYFQYYIGNKALASAFMVSGTLAIIFSLTFTSWLTKIFGKRKLFILCMLIIGLSSMAFYVLKPTDIVALFSLQLIFSLASGPTMPLIWSMYADTADYSEWKTGRRATGLIFSASTFGQKAGTALGGAIALWVLSAVGYTPDIQQSPDTLQSIRALFGLYPGLLALICGVFVWFYPLSDQKLVQIELELKARKSESVVEGN